MRTLNMYIHLDNAAFVDDPGELSRILRGLADTLEEREYPHGLPERYLNDANGNPVGIVEIVNDISSTVI